MLIYAIDLINEQMTLGYKLITYSVESIGLPVIYVPNKEIERHDFLKARIILFSFMFFDNYLLVADTFKRMRLPIYASARDFPLCIAGGEPVSDNPEPVVDFFDVFCVGEGEEWIQEAVTVILDASTKKKALQKLSDIPGSYVPALYNFEYNADESVKKWSGKKVFARKGDINKSVSNHIYHTRTARENQTRKEYLIEYHRGCTKKCAFCSYSYFQHPYRKVNSEIVVDAINDIYQKDNRKSNTIVLTQTNGAHVPIELLEQVKWCEKLPRYTSYIYTDALNDYEKVQFYRQNNVYFRFGIEGFSERERTLWGKPITKNELLMFPSLFSDKGITTKWFFISHLPTQTTEDIKELFSVFEEMAGLTNNFITIEAYVTMLQFKYATPMVFFEKKFNDEVWYFLNQNKIFKAGKIKVIFCKNEDRNKFFMRNFLSLSNRKAIPVIDGLKKNVKYDAFELCRKAGINADALFGEYDIEKRYCSEHLELFNNHRKYIRQRYIKIKQKINEFA